MTAHGVCKGVVNLEKILPEPERRPNSQKLQIGASGLCSPRKIVVIYRYTIEHRWPVRFDSARPDQHSGLAARGGPDSGERLGLPSCFHSGVSLLAKNGVCVVLSVIGAVGSYSH